MIARLFRRGVSLRLAGREVRARRASDLREALMPHVPVSAARIAELGSTEDPALAARVAALEQVGAGIAKALADGTDPLAAVADTGTALERPWPDALSAARDWRDGRAPFRRALADALLAHVGAERECLRTLLANRSRAPAPGSETSIDVDASMRQRLVFDPAAIAGEDGNGVEFNRMPKGDPLEIPMRDGQALELMLAQHRFLIVSGTPWLLIDELGEDIRLKPGRNVVGRSVDCEAVVHDSYRAISRRHAVLETEGTALLRITDISSLGTFVPRGYLDNRLH